MRSSTIQKLALAAFAVLTVWYSFYILQPPDPKPDSSPQTEFSAERAFEHVQEIATKPHPLGSTANDSTREYILSELKNLGVNSTIQRGVGVSTKNSSAGYLRNIIAKIDGSNPDKTILLMAHYDSVPNAPGAADDASGVAAILETIRAVQSQKDSPKNNIWILITNGEERGLLGAELFVDQFEELDQVDLALNFEARGSSGASLMFETGTPNGDLISHFAEATTYPTANSLMYTVYNIMPNDTDFSVIKRAEIQGLNFAFVEDFLNYHTMQDTPENLSLASLQHHGSTMLSNVRYFGNKDFTLESDSEYVYFNNATGGLLYYPSGWSFPLALITSILFLIYLVFLFRTQQVSIGSYLVSLLVYLGMIVAGALITYFGWQGIKGLHPEYQHIIQGESYNYLWYLWGFSLLILGFFTSIYSWLQSKLTIQQLLSGSYTFWILLSLLSAWYWPTASYLFTLPVLIALIGWIILGRDISENTWKSTLILGISLAAVLFMITPFLYLIQVVLTTDLLAISMILLLLILGLAWPMVWRIIRSKKLAINSGFLLTAAACFAIASTSSGFDADHRMQTNLNHVQNLNTGQAYWVSFKDTTDSWSRQFLGSGYRKGSPEDIEILRGLNVIYSPAKTYNIARSTIEVEADSSANNRRYLSLEITPNENGIGMHVDWNASAVEEMRLHDYPLNNQSQVLNQINYFQDLSKPIEMDLTVNTTEPNSKLTFTFHKMGLPTKLMENYRKRNPNMMPSPFDISNTSFWQTEVALDTLSAQQ